MGTRPGKTCVYRGRSGVLPAPQQARWLDILYSPLNRPGATGPKRRGLARPDSRMAFPINSLIPLMLCGPPNGLTNISGVDPRLPLGDLGHFFNIGA